MTRTFFASCQVGRRQLDGEAGARRSIVAVCDVNLAVMPLDDGPGDCQAKPRVPAEILGFRPHRMETVENRLAQLAGNARSLVVDPDPDIVADMDGGDFDQPARWPEADGIVDDVVDGARQPARFAHDNRAFTAGTGKCQAYVAGLPAAFPALDQAVDQRAEIDRLEAGSSKFRVGACRFADIVDQPV